MSALPLYADEVYSGGSLVSTVSPSSPLDNQHRSIRRTDP